MSIDHGSEEDATRSGRMQGYWKKDVTGAMILSGRERERGTPRPFLQTRCAFLSTTNRHVSVLPLSAPSPRSPFLPSRHPLPPVPFPRPLLLFVVPNPSLSLSLLFRSIPLLSFVLPRLLCLVVLADATGDSTPTEKRYQDDDLRPGSFFSSWPATIDPPTRERDVFRILFITFPPQAASRNFERVPIDRLRPTHRSKRSIQFPAEIGTTV